MASRLELHSKFCGILGSRNVYFNPPSTVKMQYECIRYSKKAPDVIRANDSIYRTTSCYEGVVITTDPDSGTPNKILHSFPMCTLGNSYIADNLYHFPFTLYY